MLSYAHAIYTNSEVAPALFLHSRFPSCCASATKFDQVSVGQSVRSA